MHSFVVNKLLSLWIIVIRIIIIIIIIIIVIIIALLSNPSTWYLHVLRVFICLYVYSGQINLISWFSESVTSPNILKNHSKHQPSFFSLHNFSVTPVG